MELRADGEFRTTTQVTPNAGRNAIADIKRLIERLNTARDTAEDVASKLSDKLSILDDWARIAAASKT